MDRQMTQVQVRNALEAEGEAVHQTTVSNWFAGKYEPLRRQVAALERALGQAPGVLSRHLGYVPADAIPPADVVGVIRHDPALSPEGRRIVLTTYEAVLAAVEVRGG